MEKTNPATPEIETPVTYHLTIHDFPEGERPRERLRYYGASALSNAELLAILLRVGAPGENVVTLSTRLLKDFGGLPGLDKAGFGDLEQVRGISTAKIAQLKAALELGRRLLIASPDARPQITCPTDAANLLMLEMGNLEQENLPDDEKRELSDDANPKSIRSLVILPVVVYFIIHLYQPLP